MIVALVMLAVGIALSAFFSGSETGFYRVTRVRLVLDTMGGDWISRWLLTLTNHPPLFVATTLIGNNVANYVTSLAVVLLTKEISQSNSNAAELAATVLFSPVVFVYGELLPKNLFYNAPNLLLRRGGPLFLLFTTIFLPFSLALWALGWGLQKLVGEAPLRVHARLARHELQQVLQEGQHAGILQPAQRRLAQDLFATAARPVAALGRSIAQIPSVPENATRTRALQVAARSRAAVVPVTTDYGKQRRGYVRVVDVLLNQNDTLPPVRHLIKLPRTISHLEALIKLRTEKQDVAELLDSHGNSIGLLLANDLEQVLIRGER
jgi:CBS domain containing-hemolysin-like protein